MVSKLVAHPEERATRHAQSFEFRKQPSKDFKLFKIPSHVQSR